MPFAVFLCDFHTVLVPLLSGKNASRLVFAWLLLGVFFHMADSSGRYLPPAVGGRKKVN